MKHLFLFVSALLCLISCNKEVTDIQPNDIDKELRRLEKTYSVKLGPARVRRNTTGARASGEGVTFSSIQELEEYLKKLASERGKKVYAELTLSQQPDKTQNSLKEVSGRLHINSKDLRTVFPSSGLGRGNVGSKETMNLTGCHPRGWLYNFNASYQPSSYHNVDHMIRNWGYNFNLSFNTNNVNGHMAGAQVSTTVWGSQHPNPFGVSNLRYEYEQSNGVIHSWFTTTETYTTHFNFGVTEFDYQQTTVRNWHVRWVTCPDGSGGRAIIEYEETS